MKKMIEIILSEYLESVSSQQEMFRVIVVPVGSGIKDTSLFFYSKVGYSWGGIPILTKISLPLNSMKWILLRFMYFVS